MVGEAAPTKVGTSSGVTSISYSSMKHYTAVTITLNTVPWKQLTSAHNYCVIINKLKQLCKASLDWKYLGWELNGNCQLHCHFTLVTNKRIVPPHMIRRMKGQTHYWKYHSIANYSNYRIHFKSIKTKEDLERWVLYCKKTKDMRSLYNRVAHDLSNKLYPDLDLVDYDVEFNHEGNPKYITTDKALFIF